MQQGFRSCVVMVLVAGMAVFASFWLPHALAQSTEVTEGERTLGGAPTGPEPAPVDTLDVAARARDLARLRAEIDDVERQIREARAAHDAEIRTLAVREEEIALLLQRQRVRRDELSSRLERTRARLTRDRDAGDELAMAVNDMIGEVTRATAASLPFRLEDRLGLVTEIGQSFAQDFIDAETAASRLWQFLEDEIRLCRGSGLYRQPVTIDGVRELAEVVRLGMVCLYVRLSDGRYALARERDGGYAFEVIEDDGARRSVERLFTEMRAGRTEGFFELPLGRGIAETTR